ncbi:MAG: DUF1385 domain-containing protein [Lachnospiraceae bacterium]|nr:DUF1385 domain-containing protein [Lachnospiraceae bacterium]
MALRRRSCNSGIGGQAVLEGIMMKNKDKYAVAVRKPDGEIEVDIDEFTGTAPNFFLRNVPFFRGIFNFIDSLRLGLKAINYSASFYEDTEENETRFDKAMSKVFKGNTERVFTGVVTTISILLAVGIFILLPYYLTKLLSVNVRNETYTAFIEGAIRLGVFILYVLLISFNRDIKRVYRYHGAEHKCINCIERGKDLTVDNVMHSSRLHRRCGTSFMIIVILLSVLLFFFIRIQSPVLKVLLRIALVPVIAGIAYEIIRFAGSHDNAFSKFLSIPGLLLQKITTREPDREMVEVAIVAVESVFDWKDFCETHYHEIPANKVRPKEIPPIVIAEDEESKTILLDNTDDDI